MNIKSIILIVFNFLRMLKYSDSFRFLAHAKIKRMSFLNTCMNGCCFSPNTCSHLLVPFRHSFWLPWGKGILGDWWWGGGVVLFVCCCCFFAVFSQKNCPLRNSNEQNYISLIR